MIDLKQTWAEAPTWVRVWFVLGTLAFIGAIAWDRVAVHQRMLDWFGAFEGVCIQGVYGGPDDVAELAGWCSCLKDGISAEHTNRRMLSRYVHTWTAMHYEEMAVEYGCSPQ